MSVRNLEQEIKRRLEEATKNIQLIDEMGNYVLPTIAIGTLPLEKTRDNPYIFIQTTNINDGDMTTTVEISILYSTIGIENNIRINEKKRQEVLSTGHWDIISIIDKIRENFLKDTNFRFGILRRNLKHEVYGAVKIPYYLGETKCFFEMALPYPKDDYL